MDLLISIQYNQRNKCFHLKQGTDKKNQIYMEGGNINQAAITWVGCHWTMT